MSQLDIEVEAYIINHILQLYVDVITYQCADVGVGISNLC